MDHRRSRIAETEENLRARVVQLLKEDPEPRATSNETDQLDLFGGFPVLGNDEYVRTPTSSISEFLGYMCAVLPTGDLYLFGGVLRDLALSGRKGFTSDIDIVVDDDDWTHLVKYLKSRGVTQNRFGGFRLKVNEWPIDIWTARETWAIREGLVEYHGIESLTETTILNWDAILLNWRTKRIICNPDYFRQIKGRVMDVVLTENPNPLGAAVRAFRHLCLKDAKELTTRAARYLADAAHEYPNETIIKSEIDSYRDSIINPAILGFFRHMDTSSEDLIRRQFAGASRILQPPLI